MLAQCEAGSYLLERMDVVAKLSETMTELVGVVFDEMKRTGNIN